MTLASPLMRLLTMSQGPIDWRHTPTHTCTIDKLAHQTLSPQATEDAARMANLNVLKLIKEPVAAATAYKCANDLCVYSVLRRVRMTFCFLINYDCATRCVASSRIGMLITANLARMLRADEACR